MSDDAARRPPRARPVAGLGVESLEDRAQALARRWAGELVLMRPLGALGRISLEEVVRGAPELCGQVLRALVSDEELERLLDPLEPVQAAPFADRPAALSGARDAGTVVEAVESLRGAVWEELAASAGAWPERSRERVLADAGDRLAYVCAALSAVAVGRERPAVAARPARFPERPPGSRRLPEQPVAIIDERDLEQEGEPPPGRRREEGPAGGDVLGEDAGAARAGGRAAIVEEPLPPERRYEPAPSAERRVPDIAIRDARSEHGPAAWIRSIGEQLERNAREGTGFAVVLMQVTGAGPAEPDLEAVLTRELRAAGGGTLTREREGRYWLLVPRIDRIGVEALAAGLRRTAADTVGAAGFAAEIVTGAAVCPQDGTRAADLAAHADVALYAARWSARDAGAEPG